jgi:hypothetical protein
MFGDYVAQRCFVAEDGPVNPRVMIRRPELENVARPLIATDDSITMNASVR